MKNKRITRAVTAVLLLLLLVSVLSLTGMAKAAAAVTPEPPPAQAVEAPTEPEVEYTTEPLNESPESPGFIPDDLVILEDEVIEPLKDYQTRGIGSGLSPKGASNATMYLDGRFFIYGGGGNSIKRITYDGHRYKVFCLSRTKNSGNYVPFTSDIYTWGLGSYASDKKAAIGKLFAIANTLYPNPTYSDELAIQYAVCGLSASMARDCESACENYHLQLL